MIKEITEADKIIQEMGEVTNESVELLRVKLENCTSNISEISTQGSINSHSREDALLLLAEMSSILDFSKTALIEIYKTIKDRNLKIYFEKKYLGFSNAQLERKWGLCKRQINRICKKIEKNE